MTCTHHWTVTSPCPFCQQKKIEELEGEVTALRAALAQPEAEPVNELTRTAPRVIWLCISDDEDDRDKPYPEYSGITWSTDQPVDVTVKYVRADLAASPPAPEAEPVQQSKWKRCLESALQPWPLARTPEAEPVALDDVAERLYWEFKSLFDPTQTQTPLSDRDAFKRIARRELLSATWEVNQQLRASPPARPPMTELESLLDHYWNTAYAEGREGVSYGDTANKILCALRDLYAPPARTPEAEPMTHVIVDGPDGKDYIAHLRKPLYASPPARTPMTADEIMVLKWTLTSYDDIVRAVERHHGIGGGDGLR